jgi:hypothetical protein
MGTVAPLFSVNGTLFAGFLAYGDLPSFATEPNARQNSTTRQNSRSTILAYR